MYIKIYTKSQLVLLRTLNPILGKYKIPKELLEEIERILDNRVIGKKGFIALLPHATTGSLSEVEDVLNCYPQKLAIQGDVTDIEVKDTSTWMTRKRYWYKDFFRIRGSKDKICVLYSVKLKPYYDI